MASTQCSPAIHVAVYSGVSVWEMMCRNVAVMRRKADSYLNATQILKVAGIEKGRRTKILEREIASGVHEKVQGGYGKYQGTWVPFERGVQLCEEYKVEELMRPILEFDPTTMVARNKPSLRQSALAEQQQQLHKVVAFPSASPSPTRASFLAAQHPGFGLSILPTPPALRLATTAARPVGTEPVPFPGMATQSGHGASLLESQSDLNASTTATTSSQVPTNQALLSGIASMSHSGSSGVVHGLPTPSASRVSPVPTDLQRLQTPAFAPLPPPLPTPTLSMFASSPTSMHTPSAYTSDFPSSLYSSYMSSYQRFHQDNDYLDGDLMDEDPLPFAGYLEQPPSPVAGPMTPSSAAASMLQTPPASAFDPANHILPCTSCPVNPTAPLASYLFYQGYPSPSQECLSPSPSRANLARDNDDDDDAMDRAAAAFDQEPFPSVAASGLSLATSLSDASLTLSLDMSPSSSPAEFEAMDVDSSQSVAFRARSSSTSTVGSMAVSPAATPTLVPTPPEMMLAEDRQLSRCQLMALFLTNDTAHASDVLASALAVDVNQALDDQGNTALHFAAALARAPILKLLIARGGDVCCTNALGETPLMCAVSGPNGFDTRMFAQVMALLGAASLAHVDHAGRTVLHHLALAATSARQMEPAAMHYLECLFQFAASAQDAEVRSALAALAEHRDVHGEAAHEVAERLGAKALVQALRSLAARGDVVSSAACSAQVALPGAASATESVENQVRA
ncbi:transcriptional regulator swi6 [Allomyces javanicus]|nr:transcriptional regulator swi6 [Allomyces javanicus]